MKQDINNPSSRSPVDELFARRLGQHSVVPDKAGWKNLQARMAAGSQKPRVVAFWQSPTVYRYAAAACLAALLLTGSWLWLRPAPEPLVAKNQRVIWPGKSTQSAMPVPPITQKPEPILARQAETPNMPKLDKPGLAEAKPHKTSPVQEIITTAAQVDVQLTRIDTKPTTTPAVAAPAEVLTGRVLVVTIPEPDALIEARQAANWSDSAGKAPVVRVAAKPATRKGLLQQLRRVSDSIDVASNDEQGLVNKAYLIIKNKLNKKTVRQ